MTSLPGLQVHLITPDNERFEGLCTDLESTQRELVALVTFSSDRAPAIPVGEKARLAFLGGGLLSTIDADGTTVLRTDDPSQRCYSFQLANMPKSLLLLLANRRGAARLAPRGSVRIDVLDLPPGVLSEVRLHDISATGLCIVIEPALERVLLESVRLRLSLCLPGGKPVELVTAIRHRRIYRSQVLYGLEFVGPTADFMRVRESFLSSLTRMT